MKGGYNFSYNSHLLGKEKKSLQSPLARKKKLIENFN